MKTEKRIRLEHQDELRKRFALIEVESNEAQRHLMMSEHLKESMARFLEKHYKIDTWSGKDTWSLDIENMMLKRNVTSEKASEKASEAE